MSIRFSFKTKNDKKIKVFSGGQQLAPDQIKKIRLCHIKQLTQNNNYSEERRLPDTSYNCHGMTFINKLGILGTIQRQKVSIYTPGGPEYLCDTKAAVDDIRIILTGNGYTKKAEKANIPEDDILKEDNIVQGDVVLYFRNNAVGHSCIAYEILTVADKIKLKVLSKLGLSGGEHFHYIDNDFIVKMYGKHIQIWSDSKGKHD